MINGKIPGALMYRMLKEQQKQFGEKIALSAQDKRSDGAAVQAADEMMQMTEARIYIGLNDADTKEQKYDTEKYMSVLKNVCRNYHVAFSVDIENGGYFHDDGEYTEETSFVLVLINVDREIVREIAKDLCSFFHQESVLVTEGLIGGYFISGKSMNRFVKRDRSYHISRIFETASYEAIVFHGTVAFVSLSETRKFSKKVNN